MQSVRLVKKLAPILNGVDLSDVNVGDVIAASNAVAQMLIREGWAIAVEDSRDPAKVVLDF